MNLKIFGPLFVVLAALVLFAPLGAPPLFAAGEQLSDSFPEAPVKSDAVPGEYLALFRARESVLTLKGEARAAAVAMMLEIQAELLALKYGVTVENTYSAISEANGKGLFFVRSEKAAGDPEFASKLLEEMRSDPMIEGVSPNEVRKGISVPQDFSTKR
ncbi:MAG: hypothetical protein ACOX5A_01525 [Aminivibrio sp.]